MPDARRPLWCGMLLALCACELDQPYLDPDGPRYAGDYRQGEAAESATIKVVSYNLEFGREVDVATAALETEALGGADVVLMQELHPDAVDRLAAALSLAYVYYPASVKNGQDFGNAVLSRWPIQGDQKVLLPHGDPYTNSHRIAVSATLDISGRPLRSYSTHLATPSLGLGARLDQLEAIARHADFAGGPALIGGDLNTADPGSASQFEDLLGDYQFRWASSDATDTGTSFGQSATLDYVFARDVAAQSSGTFAGEAGSDHRPIWVVLD